MKRAFISTLNAIAGCLAAAALIAGCSDKTFSTRLDPTTPDVSETSYAPLETGLRVSFAFVGQSYHTFDIEIGDPVTVYGHPGFEYVTIVHYTGATTTAYRYIRDSALFETTSVNEPGVRILQAPYLPGTTWDRKDVWGAGENARTDRQAIPKPSAGTTMSIVGFEDVRAFDGTIYSRALKVAWPVDDTHTNFYWYVLNIGMIKYELGYMASAPEAPTTIALMTDFQRVRSYPDWIPAILRQSTMNHDTALIGFPEPPCPRKAASPHRRPESFRNRDSLFGRIGTRAARFPLENVVGEHSASSARKSA